MIRWLKRRRLAREGWAAMERCWFVPYASELTPRERAGIAELERRGAIQRDQGSLSGQLHWHRQ
jgi:hypothetical protein